jgi:hypothetical protein
MRSRPRRCPVPQSCGRAKPPACVATSVGTVNGILFRHLPKLPVPFVYAPATQNNRVSTRGSRQRGEEGVGKRDVGGIFRG